MEVRLPTPCRPVQCKACWTALRTCPNLRDPASTRSGRIELLLSCGPKTPNGRPAGRPSDCDLEFGSVDFDVDALPRAFLGRLDSGFFLSGGHGSYGFGTSGLTKDLVTLLDVGQAIVQ